MAALPVSLRDKAASLRQRLHVDAAGWTGPPEDLAALPVLQDALSLDRRLAILYRPRGKGPGERRVDPLGLVAKGGVWYLVAGTPRGFRTYHVSRIEEAHVLDQPAQRPDGFDLAAHGCSTVDELRGRWTRTEAILRVEPKTARSLQAWDGATPVDPAQEPAADGERATPDSTASANPERADWITLRIGFDNPGHALFVVVGLGTRAEVLAPESLRRRAQEEHRAALGIAPETAGP